MKTIIVDLPDDPALWPQWLEARMVGLDLYDLVVGLKAIQNSATAQTLTEICGPQLPQVLQSGLKILSTAQIRSLLKSPELLLQLQEQILAEGSAYWDFVDPASDVKEIRKEQLAQVLKKVQTVQKTAGSKSIVENVKSGDKVHQGGKLLRYLPIVALAAAVLIAFGIWQQSASQGGGWGFDRSGLLTAQVSGPDYLNSLSDAAGTFSKKTPASQQDALKRLVEFRAGCLKLIAAPNQQLKSAADRDWLITKCKAWLEKIEGHIAELQSGQKAWQDVMLEANETASRMQQVLRDKASEVT